jgi:hypothetical protein
VNALHARCFMMPSILLREEPMWYRPRVGRLLEDGNREAVLSNWTTISVSALSPIEAL